MSSRFCVVEHDLDRHLAYQDFLTAQAEAEEREASRTRRRRCQGCGRYFSAVFSSHCRRCVYARMGVAV